MNDVGSARLLPIVFLLGPTASGKTGIAIELAQQVHCRLISVDSSLVYRGLDIGTAKPSAAEQSRARHRLIDIREPWDVYSAALFCSDALHEIQAARAADQLPILVGGTMLYFNALENGLAPMPSGDDAIRRTILQRAEADGWPALHQSLSCIDPASAARINPNDPQRIQRALEVWQLTGRTLTDWHTVGRATATQSPQRVTPELKIGLYPEQRTLLHQRITQRFSKMVEQGFVEEVSALRRDARLHPGLPSMRSVGYRQTWQYLDGVLSTEEWRSACLAATRQLAKRQLTWMRSMQGVERIDSLQYDTPTVVDRILRRLAL